MQKAATELRRHLKEGTLMDAEKMKRLEAAGWKTGDAEDFLELTDAEREIVNLHGKLGAAVRRLRLRSGLTQAEAAERIETTQARVANVEAGVSTLDLTFRAFFGLGGKLEQLNELGAPLKPEERVARVLVKTEPIKLESKTSAQDKGTPKRKTASG